MTGQYILRCPVTITGEKEMKKHGYTVLGGFCMALADSVPGVSGGTIAFLMGFYDAFVGSLDAVVHGTKQERLLGPLYLLKLAAGGSSAWRWLSRCWQVHLRTAFISSVTISRLCARLHPAGHARATRRARHVPAKLAAVSGGHRSGCPSLGIALVRAGQRPRPERWRSRQWCCRASPVRLC